MGRIAGKIAIVLGASGEGNFGQVIARRFALEGARVMVAGRREAPLKALAEEIGAAYQTCDITREDQVTALVEATVARFGQVDIGVNTTGSGVIKDVVGTTRDELQSMLEQNFIGPFFFVQSLIRAMPKGGSIIHLSSVGTVSLIETQAGYISSKAGFDHVIRCVANEYGAQGIRANCISPGLTDTPMSNIVFQVPEAVEAFRKEYPMGRLGTTEDVANAALWLASDECFLTGQNLQVNGGLTLRRLPNNQELAVAFAALQAKQQSA